MKANKTLMGALAMAVIALCAHGGDQRSPGDKALDCVACHGARGVGEHMNWPDLAGQQRAYLAKQLADFRSGVRHDPWMSPMAQRLSDADIADLAAYFSSLARGDDTNRIAGTDTAACTACHGALGLSDNSQWPNLAGQKKIYLQRQLEAFREGRRNDPLMSPVARGLSDPQIEALAQYYSKP